MSGWGGGSFQRGHGEPVPDWVPPDEEYTTEREAKSAVRLAFLFAAVIFGGLGFVTGKAFGETITIGSVYINGQPGAGTTVTLAPSDEAGVLGVVTLVNRHVNQGADTGTYSLVMDDLAIKVQFTWDADPVLGSDRITVTPPLGVTCDPEDCGVTVMEGFTGTVTLFDWRGM